MRNPLFFLFSLLYLLQARSQNWAAMGSNHPLWGNVFCLYHDTATNFLYAGGQFDSIDGKPISGIARWDGTKWDSLGSGIDRSTDMSAGTKKIIGYHGKIYVFGNFNKAGNYQMNGMGIWNGVSWDSISEVPNGIIYDADVFDDTLYICGGFTAIGGLSSKYAAKFDGTNWYSLDFPADSMSLTSIRCFNGKIYAGGQMYTDGFGLLAEYNGSTWIPWAGVQGDANKTVWGLERNNNLLYVYGRFWQIGNIWSPGIVSWDGSTWYGYGGGVTPTATATIRDIDFFNGKLHAVGGFYYAGNQGNGINFNTYAQWDGTDWCVTSDVFDNLVNCIEDYNNQLCIGGAFWSINADSSVSFVSQWLGLNGFSACGNATNIQEQTLNSYLNIFPNPAHTEITISIPEQLNSNIEILLFNSLGQQVKTESNWITIDNNQYKTDISSLAAGIYYLKVISGDKILSQKFIKE